MENLNDNLSFDASAAGTNSLQELSQNATAKVASTAAGMGMFGNAPSSLLSSTPYLNDTKDNLPVVSIAPSYAKQNKIAFNTQAASLERYQSHPAYSRLGFSTLRDNESFYNSNTSWTGDFVRASKYFFPVMGEVFLDNFGGGLRMFDNEGSLNPSDIAYDKGDLMTHSAKMAMSTRGGLGQSVVNIGYNMNYTLGIIAAIAAEDLLLTLAAPETGGASLTAAGARTVQGLGKAITGTFKALKSADKLKDMLSAKRLYDTVGGTGNFLTRSFTPSSYNFTREAFAASEAITNRGKAVEAVTKLAGTAKGFGALYRDLRIAGLANDESMVEAAGVRKSVKEKLINDYVMANGIMPSSQEIAAMEKKSIEAGNVDYWANLPFIYLTNNITFNNLAMPYGKGSRLMKVRAGKAGSVYAKTTGTGVAAEQLTRRQMFAKIFNDKDMRKYALNSLGSYFAANISEGVQEIYQESASKAIEDYFTETYLRPDMAGMKLAKKNIGEGLAAQVSQQGLEAFLGGFLGGGIISGGGNLIAAGTDAINAGYRKVNQSAQKAYEERLEKDKKINDMLINVINSEGQDVLAALAPELVALKQQTNAQAGMSIALELNDRVAFETIKDESLFNYISVLSQKGIVDNFLEALENHKQLSDEELLQAIPADTREEAEKTLDAIADRTKSIVATQAYVDKYFGNYYADTLMDPTVTGEERKQMQIAANAFEHAKQTLVYMYHSNKRSLERLKEITDAAIENPVVAGLMANDITPLFNIDGGLSGLSVTLETEKNALNGEITLLKQQIANLKEAAPETEEEKAQNKTALTKAEKELSFKTSLKSKLEKYGKALEEFKKNLDAVKNRGDISKVKGYKAFRYALGSVLETHAQQKGQSIDGIQLEKLVEQIIDFVRVKDMNKVFNQAVTNLSNPENFNKFYENVKAQLEITFAQNIVSQFKALAVASVEKRKDVLEALADIRVVIPNESLDNPNIAETDSSLMKFVEEGALPEFYLGDPQSNDTDTQGKIIEGSETWAKIQDILMRHEMLEEEAKADAEEKINPKKESEPTQTTPPQPDEETTTEETPDEETVEEEPEVTNYQETEIAEKYAGVIPNVIEQLQEAFKAYRIANPRERLVTLTEFMNGPGQAVTKEILEEADKVLEALGEEGVEQVVENTIDEERIAEAQRIFDKYVGMISRKRAINTLEALDAEINSDIFMSVEQKVELGKLIEEKMAQIKAKQAAKNGVELTEQPQIDEEVEQDVDSSTEGFDETSVRDRFEQDNIDDPFADDEVC